MTVGQRVLEILSKKNKTMSQLARHLGTTPSTINGWKQPNRNPSSEILIPICEFLDVSVMYLLTGEKEYTNKEEKRVETEPSISNKILKLSKNSQLTIDQFIDFLLYKEEMQRGQQKKLISFPKMIEPQTTEDFPEEEKVYIPMLGYIAAGQPIDLPDDYTFDDVVAMPCTKEAEQADFALQVKGDSMSPLIEDGETILVKRQNTAIDGQIVVASINNATTLKKLYQFPDRIELRAINRKYDPIIIDNEYSDFRILGVKL